MKKIIKKINNNGFSFIEVVLYLAIVAILLTAVVDFNLSLGGTATKLASNVDTSRNRRIALTSIDYLMRNADGLLKDVNGDCSDFSTTPQTLALYFEDDTYLPGTCVEGGGGVVISLDNRQVKMTCYPNIPYNGWYQACDSSVFPAGNAYYLTGPETIVLDDHLSFSTSTATSTSNDFINVTTVLSVGTLSQGQINVAATSTATSTVAIRNQQMSGLVAWYKFDDDDPLTAIDSANNFVLECDYVDSPTASSGLVDGSSGSFYFNDADGDYCVIDNPDEFNFASAFTITAWIKRAYVSDVQSFLLRKFDYSLAKGYAFYIYGSAGQAIFRLGDSNSVTDIISQSSIFADDTVYHMSLVYNLDNDEVALYVYEKGVGGVSTTTASSIPTLVNYSGSTYPRFGDSFDGYIDDLRIYNRALTIEEIWALQSQGAN